MISARAVAVASAIDVLMRLESGVADALDGSNAYRQHRGYRKPSGAGDRRLRLDLDRPAGDPTFAEVTDDHQFIHVDPEAAAKTPFGGTVAHGFLTLSLLSRMAADVMLRPESLRMAVNYGFERVASSRPSGPASACAAISASRGWRRNGRANGSLSTTSPSRSRAKKSPL
jgi:hypothetical protein